MLTCDKCSWHKTPQCPNKDSETPCDTFYPKKYKPPVLNAPAAVLEVSKTNYRESFLDIIKRRYRIEESGFKCLEDFQRMLESDPDNEYENNFNITLKKELGKVLDLWVLYEVALKTMPAYVDDIVLAKIWEDNKKVGMERVKEHQVVDFESKRILKDLHGITKDISTHIQHTNKTIAEGTKATNNILTKLSGGIVKLFARALKKDK